MFLYCLFYVVYVFFIFFFFKQKTADEMRISDWSSDVCSSDLAKRKMFETGKNIDWATAEALAFGTLLVEGHPVRLSGQDSNRGTFSQRHAALIDQKTEETFKPLAHIRDDQARVEVVDSPHSELAVLGSEYGYSLADPRALVAWEAQFGDFSNGAPIIIDQFIASGASTWLRSEEHREGNEGAGKGNSWWWTMP